VLGQDLQGADELLRQRIAEPSEELALHCWDSGTSAAGTLRTSSRPSMPNGAMAGPAACTSRWLAAEIIRADPRAGGHPPIAESMAGVSGSRVLGADACRAGWVAIALSGGEIRAYVHAEVDALVRAAAADGPLAVIGIDIPIGLADDTVRQADLLARRAAGPRWASVFVTPVRAALGVADHQEASALNRRLTGSGISRQAFNLRDKIMQVDRWLPAAPCPVVEVHPELGFGEMAGGPLADGKSTWAGAVRRWQLLAAEGIELSGDLGLAGRQVGIDDLLDAAAVAWTARRAARGLARRLPAEPERFSDQIDCAIWT
jgi:predicted RNase H-like nuclease